MPVFKGLLPEIIDSQAQRLLFTLAFWHGLAKLRQHTPTTLKRLSEVTSRLGDELRAFQDATAKMEVYETTREFNARQRQAAARAQRNQTTVNNPPQMTRKLCKLNLNTPKFHSVGHYVAVIAQYGTTDSFSTQTVSVSG
jgi:Sec-independent protein translocase protein TatA